MKKEDAIVNYQPELAKQLQKLKEAAIYLYRQDPRVMYYNIIADYFRQNGNVQEADLLHKIAECIKKPFGMEYFEEYYEKELQEIGVPIKSQASAAKYVYECFKPMFQALLKKILDEETLTKSERFMVKSFYNKITAPFRNPNIEVQPGKNVCYYDSKEGYGEFQKAMERSIAYIEQECQITIDIFNTPDLENNTNSEDKYSECFRYEMEK